MMIQCETCEFFFNKPQCHIKRNRHHFCSRNCRDKWQSAYFSDDRNPRWKGENVGYVALHTFIKRRIPNPGVCSNCGSEKRLDLANKSGKYLRDLADWIWLCRSCHNLYDRRERKKEWTFIKIGTSMVRRSHL